MLSRLQDLDINIEINDIDNNFLHWFQPLYEAEIGSKKNPLVFDLKEKILNNQSEHNHYHSLTLTENGEAVGGLIFIMKETELMIAYRVLKHTWIFNKTLPATPSLYTDYILGLYAHKHNLLTFSHGKDRNPHGLNSSIGLAAFKLSVGCSAYKAKDYEEKQMDTDEIKEDCFVLALPEEGDTNKIEKAYLITSQETELKWNQVTNYPEQLGVEVVYR